jgi:hypothetical protein
MSFDIIEFTITKLFKIQLLLHHNSKHYETTLGALLFIKGFQSIPRMWWGGVVVVWEI